MRYTINMFNKKTKSSFSKSEVLKKPQLIIIFFALALTGCRSSQAIETQPTQEVQIIRTQASDNKERDFAEMRPEPRSLDELTVAFSSHDIELDFRQSYFASEAQIFTAIYEGLFSYHPMSLEPVPALAERWELSDDKMQWTFTIRRNARYWNGDSVSADDFRAAWLSLLEPKRESPYSSFFDVIEGARDFRNGVNSDPQSVGIIAGDSRTLIVKLNSPASFFPAMLCHHSFSPIHPSMMEIKDWSLAPPVSNGPFHITSMDDKSIVMQKSENYWDRNRVGLNKVIIKFTHTAEEASHLWNSGEARWISGDVDIDALTDRSGIMMNVMFATHYYYIRSSQKPWNDHRVRRAMILVLPWEEIRANYYLPAKTLIFPVAGYPEIEGVTETNFSEAKKLMLEAGYENTDGLPELVIRLTPSQEAARIGAIMANAWKEQLGFNVRVEVISYDRYFQTMKEDNYTVGSITWIGDFADP